MDENFKKFKKKVWTEILIKCTLAALAAGLLAVNAVLLPCKLTGINLFWVYYVLIALGGIVLGGAVSFLIFRTNDKKIAMRLDEELNLKQRVQTTLQCGSASGDVAEMLKTDTGARLKSLPVRALPFKNLVATVLCGVIAAAALVAIPVVNFTVSAAFAKEQPADPGKTDPPRDITDWEYAALDDLIKYVENSRKMDSTVKSGMLSALNGLRSMLIVGVTESSLSMFVQNTVTSITNCVKDANEKYPLESEDEPHPQAKANSEEESYVVSTLYEIFGLAHGSGDGNNGGGNVTEPDEPGKEDPPSNIGDGVLNENETPFYDPERGCVTCGSVRAEYMYKVQQALEEGTISSEEWEYIMLTYFADLGKINNEE